MCDEREEEYSEEEIKRMYKAEKAAGLLKTKEELDQELRDAGLIKREW